MGFIPSIGGAGIYYGSILGDAYPYVSDLKANVSFHIDLQFWTQQGSFIGNITTLAETIGFFDIDVTEERYGGMKSMQFKLSKLPNFTFFNLMDVRLYVSGILWYRGELLYSAEKDTRDIKKEFECRGYSGYLKDQKVNELYENKTVTYIVNDLLQNYIIDSTPIDYDPDLIDLPDITVTKLELNNKDVFKCMEKILDLVNYDYENHQYTFGVNNDKFFYFNEISRDIINGFFEGYQFQEPDSKTNTQKIINKINIFRTQEGSQQVEPLDIVEDVESQAKYGIKEKDLTIDDYVDNDTGRKIANAILKKLKDPEITLKIENLNVETEPYPIGFYNISSKFSNYTELITDNENLTNWNLNNVDITVVTIQSDDVFSGSSSLKAITGPGSLGLGEYIEYELDDAIMFPQQLRFYFKQNVRGEKIFVTCYDEDGNAVSEGAVIPNKLLLETGGYILLETGGKINLENITTGIGKNVRFLGDWYPYELNISEIKNIKKIRINFVTDEIVTLLLDRIEVKTKSWFGRKLILDKIKYAVDKNTILATCEFGEKGRDIIRDIKEIDEKNKTVFGIFNKN